VDEITVARMARAYHYTTLSAWRRVQHDGHLRPPTPLVNPHWRNAPREAHRPHLFALQEPEPAAWKENRLDRLLEYILRNGEGNRAFNYRNKIALLELDVRKEDDPHVVAFDHFDRLDEIAQQDRSVPKMIHQARAVRRYYASRVPLADYAGQYRLPEIVIPNPVPVERARLVWKRYAGEVLFGGVFFRGRPEGGGSYS